MRDKTLHNQLPYSLHRLTTILQRLSEEILQEKLKIGFSQFKLMTGLAEYPGCQQQELAIYIGQTEASISRQIRLMKKMGLASIERDKKDSRKRHLNLTKKGKNYFEESKKLLGALHRDAAKNLSSQEITKLNLIIDKMLISTGHNSNQA